VTTRPPDDERRNEWLAVRCQLGERDAFDALVQRWHRPLWRYLHGLVEPANAVDECLQECWLRIVRGMPRLANPDRLVPWMFSIARHTAIDSLRGRYRESIDDAIDPDSLAAAPEPVMTDEDIALLQRGLAKLAPAEREVLTLFHLDELSLQDVADVLQVPLGTVKSRLHRARQALRAQLATQGLTGIECTP
jgi:RNA polymerase sigma-70 factor (ECF subfamily)